MGEFVIGLFGDMGTWVVRTNPMADKFDLDANYPNPFNPLTHINYSIEKHGRVKLSVFDISGKEVRLLLDALQGPGKYSVNFEAEDLASGIYFYVLRTSAGFKKSRKMLLLK